MLPDSVPCMRITGALLAESAHVVDGKLELRGGGLHRVEVDAGESVTVAVVVLVQARDAEVERGLDVDVELFTDSDYMPPTAVQIPIPPCARAGALAYVLDVPQVGLYTFVVGGQITLPLAVWRPPRDLACMEAVRTATPVRGRTRRT